MNGGHIAGSGAGAIVGVGLAALGTKIGLRLDDTTASMLGVAMVGIGLGIGHALSKAWAGPGIIPALRRGILGPKRHTR